ncbi:MAG: CHAT domain-containing protein [Synechococcales bacterium]|nr:CHAT domain-containing protein [Synechococcales bacterium]
MAGNVKKQLFKELVQRFLRSLFNVLKRYFWQLGKRSPRRLQFWLLTCVTTVLCLVVFPALQTIAHQPVANSPVLNQPAVVSNAPANAPAIDPSAPGLLEQGIAEFQVGNYEQAYQTWKQAEVNYTRQKQPLPALQSRINQAQALKALGNYRPARDLLEALHQQVPAQPMTREKVQIQQLLADLYHSLGQSEQASQLLDESFLQTVEAQGWRSEMSAIQFTKAMITRSQLRQITSQEIAAIDAPWTALPSAYLGELAQPRLEIARKIYAIIQSSRKEFQSISDPDFKLQADLNQIKLLTDYLPRFHNLLTLAFQQLAIATNTDSPSQPLLKVLSDNSLQKILYAPIPKPAQPTAIEPESYQAIDQLIIFRTAIAQETTDLVQLLDSVRQRSDLFSASAQPTQAAIEARINLATSFSQLGRIAESLNQLNQASNTLFAALLKSRQIPQRSPISLSFLHPTDQKRLRQLIPDSYALATTLLQAARQDAQQLENKRSQALVLNELANLQMAWLKTNPSISPDEKGQRWQQVVDFSQRGLNLMPAASSPEVTSLLIQNSALALMQLPDRRPEARVACQNVASSLTALRNSLVNVDQDTQFAYQEKIEPLYRDCIKVMLPKAGEGDRQQNLEVARQLLENLKLVELDNFFQETCIDTLKVELGKLIDQDNPTTAVIYPIFLSDRELAVLAKIPKVEALQYQVYESTPEEFQQAIEGLRLKLEDNSGDLEPAIQAASAKLYNWLIQPFETQLQQHKVDTLVFVPDDRFRNIPMGVLYHDGKYLIQNYAIAINPGLQLQLPKQQSSKQAQSKRLQILAGGLTVPRENFPGLPSVEEELKQLATQGWTSGPVLQDDLPNQAFNRTQLSKALTQQPANVVHLATHGQFGSNKQSTFILTFDEQLPLDRLSDLLRSRLQSPQGGIDLLVLSACETAKGDPRAALGMAGVALRSGVRSTLASLWTADDRASTELKVAFYQQLQSMPTATMRMSKAKALQAAQIALLEKRPPRVWAPYVLVGDWS